MPILWLHWSGIDFSQVRIGAEWLFAMDYVHYFALLCQKHILVDDTTFAVYIDGMQTGNPDNLLAITLVTLVDPMPPSISLKRERFR